MMRLLVSALLGTAYSRTYCPSPIQSSPVVDDSETCSRPDGTEMPCLKDVANCLKPDGTTAPCGPGNQMCPPGPFGRNSPQFHVRDLSCGENDPNGPVYDPVHGVCEPLTLKPQRRMKLC